ncbi:uncharacterized protein LOC118741629 [Rhagoletis pomonella]|uniref:uncharacterized protein LOC118741629 n=1 Tax=Rhagoletis pomonella TaxID=28610 RepID=UPI00177C1C78|nr:uncharacterized protein LOC118741629 [Rhagoletis pomonella]
MDIDEELCELQVSEEAGGTEVLGEIGANLIGTWNELSELQSSEEASSAEGLAEIVANLMDTSSESGESSDSSDDEITFSEINRKQNEILSEVLKLFSKQKRNNIKNYLEDVVPNYSELEFKQHFRISKELCINLTMRFEQSDMFKNLRSDKRFPAATHILVFCGLLATRPVVIAIYQIDLIFRCQAFHESSNEPRFS